MQGVVNEESRENVLVMVRVRPQNEGERGEKRCVTVEGNNVLLDIRPELKTFAFDYVADESISQDLIFQYAGRPLADACIRGKTPPYRP